MIRDYNPPRPISQYPIIVASASYRTLTGVLNITYTVLEHYSNQLFSLKSKMSLLDPATQKEISVVSPSTVEEAESRPPLYPRQKRVLTFIESYISANDRSPTLTEIRNFMQVKTLSTVHWHLIQLEKKGYIHRDRESKGINLMLAAGPFAGAIISIPLIGIVTAGRPIDAFEDRQDPVPVPKQFVGRKDISDLFCLKVRGDSMIDAYVLDGDLIICQKSNKAYNGEMVVARIIDENVATLKKFFQMKGHVKLQPANSAYQPIETRARNVEIQGKVLTIIRKL